MIAQEPYTLSNGVEIPKLGLGTWRIPDDTAAQAVVDAVSLGYRHLDTAQAYANERGVGEGIRRAGVPRDQLFVTTKLAAEIKTRDEALRAIEGSLEALGLDTIDLMLIHSPQPWRQFGGSDRFIDGNRAAWSALESAYEAGTLRAIGVSNFQSADLDALMAGCTVAPMVNQILAHVGHTPTALIKACRAQDILVEAYSPIAHGALLARPVLVQMAAAYGVTVPQLSIRYTLQLGLLPLPKSANPDHQRANLAVDFVLSEADMDTLRALPPLEDYGDASVFPVFATPRS